MKIILVVKFSKAWQDAVESSFSHFGIASTIMIRDIEARMGVSMKNWWKKPAELDSALRSIYGAAAVSIERGIVAALGSITGNSEEPDKPFMLALAELKEELNAKD